MCVYDITNRGSLMECSKWLTGKTSAHVTTNTENLLIINSFFVLFCTLAVKTVNPSAHNVLGVLVGNKNEYRHGVDTMSEVTFQEGQQAAGELGLAYFETSAVSFIFRDYYRF